MPPDDAADIERAPAEPATPERAMTVDEWEMLETAAYSYASKHAPTFVKMVARYEALAEKCRTRANALRAGRVMP